MVSLIRYCVREGIRKGECVRTRDIEGREEKREKRRKNVNSCEI